MSETTQQRIERIAEHYAFREGEKSRIIAALTAFAEEMEKWQPIETAPKDGTVVDLFCPSAYGRMANCKFDRGEWETHGNDGFGSVDWVRLAFKATHWRPLPPAPSTGA